MFPKERVANQTKRSRPFRLVLRVSLACKIDMQPVFWLCCRAPFFRPCALRMHSNVDQSCPQGPGDPLRWPAGLTRCIPSRHVGSSCLQHSYSLHNLCDTARLRCVLNVEHLLVFLHCCFILVFSGDLPVPLPIPIYANMWSGHTKTLANPRVEPRHSGSIRPAISVYESQGVSSSLLPLFPNPLHRLDRCPLPKKKKKKRLLR